MRRINEDRRAVSLVMSYVLLILIAFAIGTMVYVWIKSKSNITEGDKCPEGVSFALNRVECDDLNDDVILTINNNGRFDIHGFVVKGSDKEDVDPWAGLGINSSVFTSMAGKNILVAVLEIGGEEIYTFDYSGLGSLRSVSVQAIRNQTDEETGREEYLLCGGTIVKQGVSCA